MSTETFSEDLHWKGCKGSAIGFEALPSSWGMLPLVPGELELFVARPGTEERSCSLFTLFRTGFGFATPRGEAKSQVWERTFCPILEGEVAGGLCAGVGTELPAPVLPVRCPGSPAAKPRVCGGTGREAAGFGTSFCLKANGKWSNSGFPGSGSGARRFPCSRREDFWPFVVREESSAFFRMKKALVNFINT